MSRSLSCVKRGAAAMGVSLALASGALAQAPNEPEPATAPKPQLPPPGRPNPRTYIPPGPKMPGVSATLPSRAPFRLDSAGGPEIQSAVDAARRNAQRVLVVWGANGGDFEPKLKGIPATPDIARMLDLEYQTVWVNIRDGAHASENRVLAEAHGAIVKPDGVHAVFTVLDDAGAPVAQLALPETIDKNRPSEYNPNKVVKWLRAHVAPRPGAEEVFNGAVARARASSRMALVRFFEPREEWGERFEGWVTRPEIASILEKHMIVCSINTGRDPGAGDLFGRFAPDAQGFPWYMIVDEAGTPLAYSQTPVRRADPDSPEAAKPPETEKNIGFPTDDAEIERFVRLLRVGAPGLTAAEEKTIKDSLAADRESRAPRPAAGGSKP